MGRRTRQNFVIVVASAAVGASTMWQILRCNNNSKLSLSSSYSRETAIRPSTRSDDSTGSSTSAFSDDNTDDNPRPREIPGETTAKTTSTESLYQPSDVETYFLDQAAALGWNETQYLSATCHIWNDPQAVPELYPQLQAYLAELDDYEARLSAHTQVPDIRQQWLQNASLSRNDACAQLDLHPLGLADGIFRTSGLLSYVDGVGHVEPLLPPLRHPRYCLPQNATNMTKTKFKSPRFRDERRRHVVLAESTYNFDALLDLGYLVQDFAATCRSSSYSTTSRHVLIDMGASIEFHAANATRKSNTPKGVAKVDDITKNPPIYLMELFAQFGMPFDHVYAFEVTPIAPQTVYDKLPQRYIHAYHWINLPISSDVNSKQNPLQLLLDDYNENDVVVVKLDIDTPHIEMAMVQQILDDERYHRLIDHFYFEHHVHLNELATSWKSMNGTVLSSLQLFAQLRQRGIAAHYWP